MTQSPEHTPPGRERRRPSMDPDLEIEIGQGMLTPRRRQALTSYMEHGTYAAAARESGLSYGTVKRLIEEDDDARRAMRAMIETASAATDVTAERVLAELGHLAFGRVTDLTGLMDEFHTADEARQALDDLSPRAAAMVKEIEFVTTERGTGVKVKMHDKMGALTALARTLAMFVDRVEVTEKSDYSERLRKATSALQHKEEPDP